MKKVFSLITVFLFLLSLCACNNNKEQPISTTGTNETAAQNTEPSTAPTDPDPAPAPLPTDPAELLEYAGQTLKAAKSFEFSLSAKGNYSETTFEGELASVLFNTDANGNLCSIANCYDDDYPGTLIGIRYICGNTGYDYSPASDSNEFVMDGKFYSDTPFSADFHFEPIVSWYDILFGGDTMFENFCQLSPTVTKDETGATVYWVKNITQEKADTVLGELWDDDETIQYDIGFTVDAKGCLQKQELVMTHTEYSNTLTLIYSRIGEQIDMQIPDFEADQANAENLHYSHYINEYCSAEYSRINGNGISSFRFHYISAEDQTNVPDTYTVLKNIDGLPVCIQGGWYGGAPSAHMSENLIIPAGVTFTSWLDYGAMLFFEDTEDTVLAQAEYGMYDFRVFFAGEWSLVNGVPTPTVKKEPSNGIGGIVVNPN